MYRYYAARLRLASLGTLPLAMLAAAVLKYLKVMKIAFFALYKAPYLR